MNIKLLPLKRVIVSAIILTICSGCSTKNIDDEKKSEYRAPDNYYGKNTVNYKKAALLNVQLGEGYLAQGQVIRAKKKLMHALKLEPNLPEALTMMGFFWEKVGDKKEAEKYYKRAIAGIDGQGYFNNNYGNFLCREKRYKEADQIFNDAFRDRDYLNTAELYENAGLCSLDFKDYKKAEDYFAKAILYDVKRYSSWIELTDLSFRRGDIQLAYDYLLSFRKQVEPTPRLLWLSIQIANVKHNNDMLASEALLLKNLFSNSEEYDLYQSSNIYSEGRL